MQCPISSGAFDCKEAGDEALKIELRKKATNPEIQNKLAPFITPGFLQVKGLSFDKKPYSLTEPTAVGGDFPHGCGSQQARFYCSRQKR